MIVTYSISEDLYVSIFDENAIEITKAGPFDTIESANWWGNVIVHRAENGTFKIASEELEEENAAS